MAFSVAENSCRTSAFHPEADIRLNFPIRPANNPRRPLDISLLIEVLFFVNAQES